MTVFLLDTSVIIDVLNGKRERARLIHKLVSEGHSIACCAINVAEVHAGMRPQESPKTEALLSSLDFYVLTRDVAVLAGTYRRYWASRGKMLSIADTLIAAVVSVNGLTLMTDNLKHYPMKEVAKYVFE